MESFRGKLAVVTGGGSGMGRALVCQLAAEGCSVATCDLNESSVQETIATARTGAPQATRLTAHGCDVSDEAQVLRFRDQVAEQHATDHVDLLLNNAGIGGGASFVADSREVWERTFAVDWWGVYHCSRAFLPLLIKSHEAVIVNTSSVNGFWASLGPGRPNSAYSTAKFAVKGFSEGLVVDLRLHAPHVKVAVVMPGHVGTDILHNSRRAHGQPDPDDMTDADIDEARTMLGDLGLAASDASADQVRQLVTRIGDEFRDNAPLDAGGAATIILDGVRQGRWRILVGTDAQELDAFVRAHPDDAYDRAAMGLALRAMRDRDTASEG